MTARRRDGQSGGEFSDWVRQNPDLDSRQHGMSVMDIDFLFHQYREPFDQGRGCRKIQHVMLVETKTFCKRTGFAQADTISALHQILTLPGGQPRSCIVQGARGPVRLMCWGFHTLTFDQEGPRSSEKMWWDSQEISEEDLTRVLNFDVSPITLRVRDDRRHHGGARQEMLWGDHPRAVGA